MFLAPRTPLRNRRPSGKPFSELGRMVCTYHWIWIQIGSEQLFSESNVESLWCSKVGACLARLLSCLDLPIFLDR